MKNLFKWSTYLLVVSLMLNVACSDDEPPVDNTPDITGQWQLQMATLVDGNLQTEGAQDLTIANYPINPITVGDIQNTSAVIGGVLAGAACEDVATNGATFYLEINADKTLSFYCPAESIVVSTGSWNLVKDGDVYNLNLTVEVDGQLSPIPVSGIEVAADGSTFSGRAGAFPVPVDLAQPISLQNLQPIVVDLVLKAYN